MIRIELLAARHDRRRFDCGEPSRDDWLARMALQQQEKNYARTRVAVDGAQPSRILGYYAMVGHELDATLAAGVGLVVDALDDRAAAFYRHYGFESFRDDPRRLFLRVDWP